MKIDNLKTPPIIGNYYLVPCKIKDLCYTPIINNLHSDRENGQHEKHYHIDTRFISEKTIFHNGVELTLNDNEDRLIDNFNIEYINLKCSTNTFGRKTDDIFISNSKIKHKCIHKGKCPHRGADLSQVIPKNGIITCPLHGLKFEEKSNKLLTDFDFLKKELKYTLEEIEEREEYTSYINNKYANVIVSSEWE